jgi:hypothetical protein
MKITDKRFTELATYFGVDGHEFSQQAGAAKMESIQILKWIESGMKFFKNEKDATHYYSTSGDTFLLMLNTDDEIQVRIFTTTFEFCL